MKKRIVVVVGSALAMVAALTAFAFWPRGTTEVSEQDAVSEFRDRATTSGPATQAGADDPASARGGDSSTSASLPEPGVYTFVASGHEEVKLGPLPAETRPFPDMVTAVVVHGGPGCFEVTLNLFAEHTEDSRYCVEGGALTLSTHAKHQKIGPLSPTGTLACDPAVLMSPDQARHDLACTLELSGGPAAISAELAGTATRGEPEERTVGSASVKATPLTISHRVTGDLSGTWTETWWLTGSNLPVRIERTLALSGPARFTETSVLELKSLEPTR